MKSSIPPVRSELAGRILARAHTLGISFKPGIFGGAVQAMEIDRLARLAYIARYGTEQEFRDQLKKDGLDV